MDGLEGVEHHIPADDGGRRMTIPLSPMDTLTLLAAIPVAALGGQFFLKGVLGVAAWLRVPRLLVAATFAAFATSSPELTVSTMAALDGKPEIGLGDALGSNVVNISLILGLALLSGPLPARFSDLRRDFLLALAIPMLTLVLAVDGTLSRAEGVLLLVLFLAWLGLVSKQAIGHRRHLQTDVAAADKSAYAWLSAIIGLACLILAGRLFVAGASGIAATLGLHTYAIGATVVAIGTSMPELVATLLSRRRGHDDLGLGIILGSNLFNGLAIVGLAAAIHPIRAPLSEVGVTLGFGLLTMILILPNNGFIAPVRGAALLAVYLAYGLVTLAL